MMSALIYTKFILSVAYIVGFYRHLQFYTAQVGHFKINMLLFVENCIYALLSFVLLWTLFEKKELHMKMLKVIGIYAFISLSFFALYVFKSTLSSIEYWCAICSQIFNILIIAKMYVFRASDGVKRLNKRSVTCNIYTKKKEFSDEFLKDNSFVFSNNQKNYNNVESVKSNENVMFKVFEDKDASDRGVKKIRNFNPSKKTKFKRLKKFDLKKV